MTTILTIISGILIFLVGQYFQKFVIEPVINLRAHIGRIGYILIFHANKMYHEHENIEIIRNEIRDCASKLIELTYIPVFYSVTHRFFNMPSKNDVMDSIPELIGLSNTVGRQSPCDDKVDRINKIRNKLRLPKI